MTTRPFVPPPRVPAPEAGGGKIAVEPPIAAPVPPPRSIWGIVLPIGLVVGVVGFIVAMYVSGQRSLATGFAIFPLIMLMSMGGMLFRGRGAAQKMPWSQLEQYRREYFARLDEVREEVQEAARKQWEHREHFHWAPKELVSVAGSPRMWERRPGDPEFGVVRLGTGRVDLAMTIDKPQIAAASKIEPATGHALRKFLLEQRHVRGMARVVWLERNPGIALVGDIQEVCGVARSMICQLAAFHSPKDLQIMVVTSAPAHWDWVKWLPHCQHREARDGCGERRLVFSSPADLEAFAGDDLLDRKEWTPPASGLHGGPDPSAPPLWVIIDDNCGSAEEWAGATGKRGVGRVSFVRLAPDEGTAGRGVGFDPETTYLLSDGVLRKRVGAGLPVTSLPEELDDAFYAAADSMSIEDAERLARGLAPWRPVGAATEVTTDGPARDLLEVLGIRDARKLDVDRLWSARRTQNRLWMRFPIGLDPTGEVVELDLKETSQYGMGMHSVLIGFSGSGKSETIITEVTSLALTHSPETVNVAFLDWKMKSAGIVLERFPHVVASVSNLGDEMHLVERMLEALEGELDRRGALCAATNCKDLNVYNEKRMIDPSLEPVPGLVVIIDEYQELFGSELGSKFIDLCWRIVRQGRSLHVFLQLAGQTVDTHRLMKIRSLIGFFMALRTGTEEDSREAIGSSIAAHLPEKGKEGTGYLREGQRPPREFRAFYSSPPFVPPPESDGQAPVAAGTWFTPRSFTATTVPDDDGLLAPPETNGHHQQTPVAEPAPPLAPGELPPTLVDTIVESLRATGARPPRRLWLPPLEKPAAADELVRLVRGKPWDVDYGKNPGLAFAVGIEDRPREHRQDVHFLDLLSANALVIGAPQSGVTNTLATMMTTAALMYRPERVQFYCVAAGGPTLAAVAELPHVAGMAPAVDREGVGRIIASVLGIVAEREAIFAKSGLDMDEVRRRKFSEKPEPVPVAGGDVVLVIDGWATFAAEYPQLVDHIVALARSLSYGVHVVISHTSYLQGFKQALKPLAAARIELRLTDPADSEMDRQLAKKVPKGIPGRGLTKAGKHLLIGVPELAQWGTLDLAGRVAARDIGAVIAQVSGIQKAATVSRLPESVPFEEVQRLAAPVTRRSLVPFGLSELDLGPSYLDLADHPHAIAVGAPRSGRTNFLRVLCRAITTSYRPEEAQILVLDPRRTLLGVVQGAHLRDYAYTQSAIREAIRELVAELDSRQPPHGTTQEEMMTKTFWSGPEIFVVIDDAGVWPTMDNPLMGLGGHIEGARDTGLHVFAATAVANWNQVAIGSSVLGKLRASLAPILILDGRRDAGKIVGDIYAEPQRPGKATYFTRSGTVGALIGWSEPPTPASVAGPQT